MSFGYSLALTVAIAALCLTGCGGDGKPSESKARTAFEGSLKGPVRLLDFRKIDAQEGEMFGVKVYSVEFEAKVEITENAVIEPDGTIVAWKNVPRIESMRFAFGQKVAQGTQHSFKGQLIFQRTERGWKGPDGKVY